METILSINLIASNPEIRRGRPVVAGTSLCVSDIVAAMLFHKRTTDELASDYGLSMAQVHAALSYYYEHKGAIDQEIRDEIAKSTQQKENRIGSRHSLLPR